DLGSARYLLELLDRRLYVPAPACKVSLASVAEGVASPEVVEPQHVKTGSNQAGRQLPHGAIGKDLLVTHRMAEQHGTHLAEIRRGRLVVTKKAPLTVTKVKCRHNTHAFALENPAAIMPELANAANVQPMIRSRRIHWARLKHSRLLRRRNSSQRRQPESAS